MLIAVIMTLIAVVGVTIFLKMPVMVLHKVSAQEVMNYEIRNIVIGIHTVVFPRTR